MAFAAAGRSTPLAEINVTPLVDVMLVLLIIFMVTAPMMAHTLRVDLPQRAPPTGERWPEPITLRIDATGQLSWDGEAIAVGDLQSRLADVARINTGPLPALRIDAHPASEYQVTAQVLAAAKNARMAQIVFER